MRKIFKKISLVISTLAMLSSTIVLSGCNSNQPDETGSSYSLADRGTLTDEGKRRISVEPEQGIIWSFIDSIISKGGEAIMGGVTVYAKAVVLNLLKECGLDLRDATTKTLEKMQQQLGIIEDKIDAIAAKQERYYDENVLNKLLDQYDTVHSKYIDFVCGGLAWIAEQENDEAQTEEEVEEKRIAFYNKSIASLTFDGAPFATFVTDLAKKTITPNQVDQSKGIFYYYDHTIGAIDTWTIQYYNNIKNFITYIDGTLIMLSNLAKFQIQYMAKDADEATLQSYKLIMNKMADAVNAVNLLCAEKLKELDYIRYEWRIGINKYISTGTYYSCRMATLTYNLDDRGSTSRQGLWLAYCNDTGKHGNLQVAYLYQPNTDIVTAVANDFREYSGSYCSYSYTIQDYLQYVGFWSKNMTLFNESAGLFCGNMYVDKYGFMHDDKSYSVAYFDVHGNYTRRDAYRVASYHTWYGGLDHTELRYYDTSYFLCFGKYSGVSSGTLQLDGMYKETYMSDVNFTVSDAVYYTYHYKEMYQKVGPIAFHDAW